MNNMNDNFFKSIRFQSYYWDRVMMSLCIGRWQRSNICFCWLWLWNFSDSCCYMILRSRHLYVLNITHINQNQSKYLRKHILWYFALLPHIVFGSKYFYVLLVNRIYFLRQVKCLIYLFSLSVELFHLMEKLLSHKHISFKRCLSFLSQNFVSQRTNAKMNQLSKIFLHVYSRCYGIVHWLSDWFLQIFCFRYSIYHYIYILTRFVSGIHT